MVLYIEYVLMDNVIVDYMLLNLLGFTFKDRIKKSNLFWSVLIGTVSALCLPFIMKYKVILFEYKLLTACIMVLVLKKYKTYKRYFLYLITLIVYTFIFGGVALSILNIFDISYTNNGLLLYDCEFPISLFIVIFWAGSWLLKKIVITLSAQMKMNNYLYRMQLTDNGQTVECMGYYDSGNTINRDGSAVNIISIDMFMKLYKDYPVEKLLFRNIDNTKLKNPTYIDVKTLTSTSKYLSFVIDKMIIDKKEYDNVVVAVATNNFKNYDCIINSVLLGGSE